MSLTTSGCLLLSEWIFFLLAAVPSRSRRIFVELLIGSMLNPEGWITRAIGTICRKAHWTTYYKLIERAHVSVADFSIRLLQLVQTVFPTELVNPIIDDTLVPGCAETGPGISIKHDHCHKSNHPTFLNSQCWATLAFQRCAFADRCLVHAQKPDHSFCPVDVSHLKKFGRWMATDV